MKSYIVELSELPVSIVLGFDEPDGQISMLNKFLTHYRDQQASTHCSYFSLNERSLFSFTLKNNGIISHENSRYQ